MQEVNLECEDHPGETMTVWLEAFDEARDSVTALVANTSVRVTLWRDAERGGYRGVIGARTYFFDPPARKARASRGRGRGLLSARRTPNVIKADDFSKSGLKTSK